MKLTLILFKRKYPKGHLFTGKFRLIKRVEGKHIAEVKRDLERDEQNMLYLRHPYLKAVEYESFFGNDKYLRRGEEIKAKIAKRLAKWPRTEERRKLETHLNNLRASDAWE